jgi:hypothetical protein
MSSNRGNILRILILVNGAKPKVIKIVPDIQKRYLFTPFLQIFASERPNAILVGSWYTPPAGVCFPTQPG